MTIARLSMSLLLGACTANVASPTSGSPGATLPCEPSLVVECSEVLRIAARLRRRTAVGLGGLEARCEDDDGTALHGMVALARPSAR